MGFRLCIFEVGARVKFGSETIPDLLGSFKLMDVDEDCIIERIEKGLKSKNMSSFSLCDNFAKSESSDMI